MRHGAISSVIGLSVCSAMNMAGGCTLLTKHVWRRLSRGRNAFLSQQAAPFASEEHNPNEDVAHKEGVYCP